MKTHQFLKLLLSNLIVAIAILLIFKSPLLPLGLFFRDACYSIDNHSLKFLFVVCRLEYSILIKRVSSE